MMDRNAHFSDDGIYRYWLSRHWDYSKNNIAWIMLNPSTADGKKDDNTIRKCIKFSEFWGFGGMIVVNLFAARSTDPKQLKNFPDPVGPDNNYFLLNATKYCKTIIAAWGNHGTYLNQSERVKEQFRLHGKKLNCLHVNNSGEPKHPLYISMNTQFTPFEATA